MQQHCLVPCVVATNSSVDSTKLGTSATAVIGLTGVVYLSLEGVVLNSSFSKKTSSK
jgi:hypothetical protein